MGKIAKTVPNVKLLYFSNCMHDVTQVLPFNAALIFKKAHVLLTESIKLFDLKWDIYGASKKSFVVLSKVVHD